MDNEIVSNTSYILFIWSIFGILLISVMPSEMDVKSSLKQIFIGGPIVWMMAIAHLMGGGE